MERLATWQPSVRTFVVHQLAGEEANKSPLEGVMIGPQLVTPSAHRLEADTM